MTSRPRVLYVAGLGASGTTLIDNVLSEGDGWISTGELQGIWRGFIDKNQRCGCGQLLLECSFWEDVLVAAFDSAGVERPNSADVLQWQSMFTTRHLPGRVRDMGGTRRAPRDVRAYLDIAVRLYQGIATVTGARTIVDSSKTPSYASVFSTDPRLSLFLLHVVRDPRGVAFSWCRRQTYRPADTAMRWNIFNLAAHSVSRRIPKHRAMVLRYEDFIATPTQSVGQVRRWMSEDPGVDFVSADSASLRQNHTVGGNDSRFRTGDVSLKADDRWRSELPRFDRGLVEILTLPLLVKYGYVAALPASFRRLVSGAIDGP